MAAIAVYVTAGSTEEGLELARAIVGERLAACGNVIPGVRSVYWWRGAREEADEAVVIFKSMSERRDALVARIRALHAYELPCVTVFEIAGGDPDYLAWVAAETGAQP